jgi:hypothetical protein
MATVLDECNTEEQRFVVRFSVGRGSMERIFIKKYFLFTVGSVCRVKQFTIWSRNSSRMFESLRWWKGVAELAETTVERLSCCGFRYTGKVMVQEYQCLSKINREIKFFFQFRILYVLRFICIVTYLLTLPRTRRSYQMMQSTEEAYQVISCESDEEESC